MKSAQRPSENSILIPQNSNASDMAYEVRNPEILNQLKALQYKLEKKDQENINNLIQLEELKNALIDTGQRLEKVLPNSPTNVAESITTTLRSIKSTLNSPQPSLGFELHFQKSCPTFYGNIKKDYPNLTKNELKHCAYIKVNMSNKEIARLINVSPKSVVMAQYRLKKKINLPTEMSLFDLVCKYA